MLLEIIVDVDPEVEGLAEDPEALARRVLANSMSIQNDAVLVAASFLRP